MYKLWGKRIVDIIAALSFLILLFPILILTGVLIKIFDPGPIIFYQKRIGKDGIEFIFLKFRSMPVTTENLPSDKLDKLQLSWIGKLIRRTNIDELPQLLNILKGEMSIVGPRPPLPSQKELLKERSKYYTNDCLPGLTGLAQISSYNGMCIKEKARLDGIYVSNISFLYDLGIVIKTFRYLLKPPPVY